MSNLAAVGSVASRLAKVVVDGFDALSNSMCFFCIKFGLKLSAADIMGRYCYDHNELRPLELVVVKLLSSCGLL